MLSSLAPFNAIAVADHHRKGIERINLAADAGIELIGRSAKQEYQQRLVSIEPVTELAFAYHLGNQIGTPDQQVN